MSFVSSVDLCSNANLGSKLITRIPDMYLAGHIVFLPPIVLPFPKL